MPDKVQIQVAVRALVEYVYRSGSIDSGFRSASSLTEGTKAHQRIQREYGELDQKEVYLSAEVPCGDGLVLAIDGRCDGILQSDDSSAAAIIEEIKSTAGDLSGIEADSYPVHWAQAKCYAYMYALQHGAETMTIQLTYVQVVSGQEKRFRQQVSFQELELYVRGLAEGYSPYAHLLEGHKRKRDASIAELAFPFPAYRAGQRSLAGAVYRTIEEGGKLFAQAPTGIGKTISTTFPAVKAIGKGHLQHFFYLTAKTTTRTAAEAAFQQLQAQGLHLQSVTITAKEKICFQPEVRCNKADCPFADGYYDRINGAILDLLTHETLITRPVIEAYARKHQVCPFEFSLDAAYAVDVVICDYNYVFDPRVALKRLFGEQKKRTALLIDEAHNMVDRARSMYSAALLKSDFLEMQRSFKGDDIELSRAAKAVNDYFIAMRKESGEPLKILEANPRELAERIEAFVGLAERHLTMRSGTGESAAAQPRLLEVYFASQAYLRIDQLFDEHYVAYAELSKQDVVLKLFCLDPSELLRTMGKGYRSHIYFSATLMPYGYFRDMLGADADDYALAIPSPFNREQLRVRIEPLSTRYHDREATKGLLVKLLLDMLATRPMGNYLIFFPSYAYMNTVYEAFEAEREMAKDAGGGKVNTMLQRGEMTEEERETFLAAFDADNRETLVGFAVMGGIFSEGIDLVGDRLTGVAIVGVGLPQIGPERDMIKRYFQKIGKNGYDYAYVYPGINKVLQAGGRLIRSEIDSGDLLLVDDRYLQPQMQRLLPEEWRSNRLNE